MCELYKLLFIIDSKPCLLGLSFPGGSLALEVLGSLSVWRHLGFVGAGHHSGFLVKGASRALDSCLSLRVQNVALSFILSRTSAEPWTRQLVLLSMRVFIYRARSWNSWGFVMQVDRALRAKMTLTIVWVTLSGNYLSWDLSECICSESPNLTALAFWRVSLCPGVQGSTQTFLFLIVPAA